MKQAGVLVGISLLWSISWLMFKVGVLSVPPMTLAYSRFAVALPILGLVAWRTGARLPHSRRDWFWLAMAGLSAFALNYILVFWGSQFIPAGLSAVLQSTIPACTLLLGLIWLPEERLSRLGVASIFAGMAGVALIFGDQLQISSREALLGCIALALTALTNAAGAIIVKRNLRHLNGIQLALGQQMIGVPVLMGVALASDGLPRVASWGAPAIGAILYMGVFASVIAFLGYYWLLQQWPAARSMLYALIMPVMTLTLGWLFLGEALTPITLMGAGIVLASVALAARR